MLQVCFWFHRNVKDFRHKMLTALNESAKRIGGPDWGKQIVVISSNIGHDDCHTITVRVRVRVRVRVGVRVRVRVRERP